MTIHAQTLVNPGAELGDLTGWSHTGDDAYVSTAPDGIGPHSGSWCFGLQNGFSDNSFLVQDIAVDVSLEAAIDAGTAAVRVSGWYNNDTQDWQALYVEFYDASAVLIGSETTGLTPSSPINTWAQHELFRMIPENTRTIRIGAHTGSEAFGSRARWDDFEMDISDSGEADWPEELALHTSQYGVYALVNFPSEALKASQVGIHTVEASEGSSGLYEVNAHQYGVYVLCRGKTDRRDLRAWTFTQDDHDFWVLQLGDGRTLVFDKLTGQWVQWRSPDFAYWRGNDGVQWEGWNVCCDSESGRLWIIDPEGRLDDDTTPITSIISGKVGTRMRTNSQCHMAELTVSEGAPPTGIAEGAVAISLRTTDDDGINYVSHGSVTGEAIGEDITVRWYGLGLMSAPGRVFEITDTGYARRVDGLNIEVGDEAVG